VFGHSAVLVAGVTAFLFFQTALAYARVWHHVDASDRVLGKLAERVALVLMGKHKPIFDAAGPSPLRPEACFVHP
jgi:hypothetical protein